MVAPNQLAAILQNMSEGVILLDPFGGITLANRRIETLLGLRDLEGSNLATHPPENLGFSPDSLAMLIQQLAVGMQPHQTTHYHIHQPHLRFIRRRDIPLNDENGGQSLLMLFRDETEARQAQDEITSMVVHDLRGPLSAVTASTRLLRDLAEPDDPFGKIVLQTMDISGRAVRKLLNLVNSLLDVFKMENGIYALEREPVDLYELVSSVLADFSSVAQEMDITLAQDISPALPLLSIDADKIERVLYNLIDNAIKFTPGRGEVRVSAEVIESGVVQIAICDDGPGIPPEMRERLFNRFEQVEGSAGRRRGTGLGLTFCKLAIEAHGGRIWIEDHPHGGSIFAFTLPSP